MTRASRADRLLIAERRIHNILSKHTVAVMRTLEQKISDAGPSNQRVDPHILTEAKKKMVQTGRLIPHLRNGVHWYHLSDPQPADLTRRLAQLGQIYDRVTRPSFTNRVGEALEIAVYRALLGQSEMETLGGFINLDEHDDSSRYRKEEPPALVSGRSLSGGKRLDFLVFQPQARMAGIEVKNIREWLYPDRTEIVSLLAKCCQLDAVPVLIARRYAYSTFAVLGTCGVLLFQNYNQLYPASETAVADQARHKDLLGLHDIRTGNEPDKRLLKFIKHDLPSLLPDARTAFDEYRDLMEEYALGSMPYKEFTGRVKRRSHGEPEDGEFPGEDEYDF